MAATKRTRTKKTVSETETSGNVNTDEVKQSNEEITQCEEPVPKKREETKRVQDRGM